MNKTPNTVVADVYELLETKEIPDGVNLEEICTAFGLGMAQLLRDNLRPEESRTGLRLSGIGKPDRQVYNAAMGVQGEPLSGQTYLKFLYGHITEELILALVEASGHVVSDRQKTCYVEGIKGHMDGRIDGVLMDVKSASSYGFKKFKNNTLHEQDDFGYIAQLRAYAHSEGDTEYGWLAMDKTTGALAWLGYDENNPHAVYADALDWDVAERVQHLKKMVADGVLPAKCFEPVPDGKSGNMKLDTGCVFCQHKLSCWPNARRFSYSNGVRWLTTVVKDPRVLEIPDEF